MDAASIKEEENSPSHISNMAAARRAKRAATKQNQFISLDSSNEPGCSHVSKRKRVNKNKKKNWNKYSDIQDVDDFMDDVRLQERATGGLISERLDDDLFFVDYGDEPSGGQKSHKKTEKPMKIDLNLKHDSRVPPPKEGPTSEQLGEAYDLVDSSDEPSEGKKSHRKTRKPLRIDLTLKHDSRVPPPKDVLAYQQPNAKKLRRTAEKAEQLSAKGIMTQKRKRQMLPRRPVAKVIKKEVTEANNNPERDFYDLWQDTPKETGDPWYLEQTGKKRIKRPEKMNVKPSVLPAVEVIAPGGSYNPDFFSHQALLQEAHEAEVLKLKEEEKIERQLAVNKEELATDESIYHEQLHGLVEEKEVSDEEEDAPPVGAISQAEKKTEKQRKKEKELKVKTQMRQRHKQTIISKQQLFKLRSIQTAIKKHEQRTKERQKKRKADEEAQKAQPRRLGRLKFKADDLEVQLSDELPGSLRKLKPEGSVLKDRFKSLQKRNLIEPRERAKFKRRLKTKYVEKRAFKSIT